MHPPASGQKYAPVRFRLVALLLTFSLLALAIPHRFPSVMPATLAASSTIVISQFQVAGVTATEEFIELHNVSHA